MTERLFGFGKNRFSCSSRHWKLFNGNLIIQMVVKINPSSKHLQRTEVLKCHSRIKCHPWHQKITSVETLSSKIKCWNGPRLDTSACWWESEFILGSVCPQLICCNHCQDQFAYCVCYSSCALPRQISQFFIFLSIMEELRLGKLIISFETGS